MIIAERNPEAVLDFWLSGMRTPAEASADQWRDRMLMWKIGPLARSTENRLFFQAQREWCEQIHREGMDRFFADPVWDSPRGLLAKLIVLDQFPRSTYRGAPPAYEYGPITEPIACRICAMNWDQTCFNVIERMWVYMPLTHSEDLGLHELAVEKFIQWNQDLVSEVSAEHRKINQYVSWSFIKATIEHSEVLLLYGRFPHRNAIYCRPHKAGEPRYLNDPMRPLWTFTQPLNPEFPAFLGALWRVGDGLDENSVSRESLSSLHREAAISLDDPGSLMDVFDISAGEGVPYGMLYRHMRLPEKAVALDALRKCPAVAELMDQIAGVLLKDPSEGWPPRSAKNSIHPVIDVNAINKIVRGEPSTTES